MTSPALRARTAVLATFAFSGFAFSTWASRIPTIRTDLGLDPGQLGLLLLSMSTGAVLALPTAGKVASWIGTRKAVAVFSVLTAAGIALIGLGSSVAHAMWLAGVGLFLTGYGNGVWDVSMNLEGTVVERAVHRAVMPHFHAAFSGGTVAGALLGVAMTALRVPVAVHLGLVALAVGLLNPWAVRAFIDERAVAKASGASAPGGSVLAAWAERRTVLIGLLTMVAAFTEGVANDWLSVAFVDGHDLPDWAGVAGFAVFLTAMTAGRILGTGGIERYGRVPVLRITFGVAVVGSLLVVFGPTLAAYVGAALWGVGASLGFPIGMSAAADEPRHAAARVSVVATIAYVAFLAGPPLLGFLGDHIGVLRALGVVSLLLIPALLLVPVTREPQVPRPAQSPVQ